MNEKSYGNTGLKTEKRHKFLLHQKYKIAISLAFKYDNRIKLSKTQILIQWFLGYHLVSISNIAMPATY